MFGIKINCSQNLNIKVFDIVTKINAISRFNSFLSLLHASTYFLLHFYFPIVLLCLGTPRERCDVGQLDHIIASATHKKAHTEIIIIIYLINSLVFHHHHHTHRILKKMLSTFFFVASMFISFNYNFKNILIHWNFKYFFYITRG